MKVSVKQGSVHVNSLWLVRHADGVAVIEGDLKAKRAEVSAMGGDTIYLEPGPETLYGDRNKESTEIHVEAFPGQILMAHVCRYTLYIYVYTHPDIRKPLWSDPS